MLDTKPTYKIESDRIYLRVVQISDANEDYLRWLHSPEVNQFLEIRFNPPTLDQLQAYVKEMSDDPGTLFLAIVLKNNDRHVGNVKLGPIDWMHRTAEVGIIIGERDCWGQGYASEAIKALTDFSFDTLNLRKVTAGAYRANEGSIKAFQKAGFEIEGIRKKQYLCHGKYTDGVLMGRLCDRPEKE